MKKLLTLLLTLAMVMSLVACKKPVTVDGDVDGKPGYSQNNGKDKDTSSEDGSNDSGESESDDNNSSVDFSGVEVEGDPIEYGMGYWEELFPGKNICPFNIEVGGVERPYYLIMVETCAMVEWINTPFNWDGWHLVGDDIVNADETYAMTEEWLGPDAGGMFSSCCTVTTKPYDPSNPTVLDKEDDYEDIEYDFDGYTEIADWPAEDFWAKLGLPNLEMPDDSVNGHVHISTYDWIAGLYGTDGFLIEAEPSVSTIDGMVTALRDAGIKLCEYYGYDNNYYAFYENRGKMNKLTLIEHYDNGIYILVDINTTEEPDYYDEDEEYSEEW